MSLVQGSMIDVQTLAQQVRQVCEPRAVSRVDLFGSWAKANQTQQSDVDLIIDFVPGFEPTLLDMGEIKELLEEKLGRPVDLISRRGLERSGNASRRNHILSHIVPLYAR